MALRYDVLHNRYQNVRYNTASHVDYESLLQSKSDLLTIDETYEVTKLFAYKLRSAYAGVAVSLLSMPLLGRIPAFAGLHGYTRGLVRAAVLVLPWTIPSLYYGSRINHLMDSAVDRRLNEFYVNPVSRQFVI
jgi:hypothetical protein